MKVLLVFSACLVAAMAVPVTDLVPLNKADLLKDLKDFINAAPMDDLVALVTRYVREDPEVSRHWQYFVSQEFKENYAAVQKTPEFRVFLNYMDNAGVDIYTYVNMGNEYLGIDKIEKKHQAETYAIGDGMKGLVKDFQAMLPFDVFDDIYLHKILNSGVFAVFANRMQSKEFAIIVNDVLISDANVHLRKAAFDSGIDVLAVEQLLRLMIGIRERS